MEMTVIGLDIGIICTVLGTGIAIIAFVYSIIRNFRQDLKEALYAQDERIFQLATGKTLREAMMEAKRKATGE